MPSVSQLNSADIAVAIGVGVAVTGITITVSRLIMVLVGRYIRSVEAKVSARTHALLDGLTAFVVGPKRLDHTPMYSCTIAGLFLVAVFWLFMAPLPGSVIFPMSPSTQITLATCWLVGSGTCLYGIAMGTPFDVWRYLGKARGELDIRRAYRVGISGLPSVIVGVGYYTAILAWRTPPTWAGANCIFLTFTCLGFVFQTLRFLMENRRISHLLPVLIEHEISRREIDEGSGCDV
jgi:hypothetical protein